MTRSAVCHARVMPAFDGDVLRARGLVKQYKRIRAVDGIDLTVGAGERVALLGPNGAGKTTTLLMLLGVVTPDAGWVEVGGLPAAPSPQQRRRARRFRRRLPAAARAAARPRVPRPVRAALRAPRPDAPGRGRARAVRHHPSRRRHGQRALLGSAHARRDREGDVAPPGAADPRRAHRLARPRRRAEGPHRARTGCAPRTAPPCS